LQDLTLLPDYPNILKLLVFL